MQRSFFTLQFILLAGMIMAQGIVSVSPSAAPLNSTGVNVTIVLDSAIAPPGPVLPTAINIGPSLGTNVTRSSQYIYATFNFTHMISGVYNVTVLFPGAPPDYPAVYFTIPAAFSVTDTITTPWTIPGTNVTVCYDTANVIPCPTDKNAPYYGQFNGITPSYVNNGNGTITDLVSGLMWQRDPGAKKTFIEALSGASTLTLGGYNDWRLPTIKELYSLIEFTGTDPNVPPGIPLSLLSPFIDTNYFVFHYGDTTSGERIIDAQYWSCREYVSTTMGHDHSVFGVNFADGRIKSYPRNSQSGETKMYARYVRGMTGYGINHFQDNGTTISDDGTGLMWSQTDSQYPMDWQIALAYVQSHNVANYCGYNDWRLPDTKELESIIDYTRSPVTTNSAAIDPLFQCTQITDEYGQPDWPWFWVSTTHASFNGFTVSGASGVYVCFGSAFGWQKNPGNSYYTLTDVHGAGAQRSSPKNGSYLGDSLGVDSLGHTVYGKGPQGDVLRTENFVRLVRTIDSPSGINEIHGNNGGSVVYPNPFTTEATIRIFTKEKINDGGLFIYDLVGNLIWTIRGINSDEITFERHALPPGFYFYKIMNNGAVISTGKLAAQ
jgi:hypothetical protein